jgi:hypothetical protein
MTTKQDESAREIAERIMRGTADDLPYRIALESSSSAESEGE